MSIAVVYSRNKKDICARSSGIDVGVRVVLSNHHWNWAEDKNITSLSFVLMKGGREKIGYNINSADMFIAKPKGNKNRDPEENGEKKSLHRRR